MKKYLSIWSALLLVFMLASCGKNSSEQSDISTQTATSDKSEIMPVDSLTTEPQVIKRSDPEYPAPARKQQLEGTAIIRVTIFEDGQVGEARILKSSGHDILDKSALNSVYKFEFSPGEIDGRPVKTQINIPCHFQLD
ncbi:energy transducer TonB [Candidatus Saccharibacteria bacterium]|nr:energy transducer TonB [Candidatus Saccharibacteria bacterium]NIV71205.1 TonB family protein [Calditrichia bacterium]NIW78087.1 TonB family protein [Calditrichia bacterium]